MVQNFPNKERACGLSNCPLPTLGELFTPQPDWSLKAEAGDWDYRVWCRVGRRQEELEKTLSGVIEGAWWGKFTHIQTEAPQGLIGSPRLQRHRIRKPGASQLPTLDS